MACCGWLRIRTSSARSRSSHLKDSRKRAAPVRSSSKVAYRRSTRRSQRSRTIATCRFACYGLVSTMCGRYTITRQDGLIEEMEAVLDPAVTKNEWWKPRFNVAPTQDAPVVTLRDGVRTIEMMRWGLIPFWAGRDGAKPPLMINARVESVNQKPMFRDALQRRRCLVPADGFYEWKKIGGTKSKPTKQPMWIHPRDGHVFAFAGLWARA